MMKKPLFQRFLKLNAYNSIFISFFLLGFYATAQAENKFTNEVKNITSKYNTLWNSAKETIVFTGSSSIRLWKSLPHKFANHQVVNTGFGGSEASDLLLFLDDLVLAYTPKKVFIYEGDNDLWAGKRPHQVLETLQEIVQRIRTKNPMTKIVLISAKPSISRWKIRRKYRRLNRKMEGLTKNDTLLDYADVWHPMLENKKLKTDLFIEDGLHMNQKGYDIWHEVMKELIVNP